MHWLDFLSPFFLPLPSPALSIVYLENVLFMAFRKASKSPNNKNLWFTERPEERKNVEHDPLLPPAPVRPQKIYFQGLLGQQWRKTFPPASAYTAEL